MQKNRRDAFKRLSTRRQQRQLKVEQDAADALRKQNLKYVITLSQY